MRNCLFRISAAVVLVASCSAPQPKPTPEPFDLRSLIRPAAQRGVEGVDQAIASLRSRYRVPPDTALAFYAKTGQPLTLDDGTIVVQALSDVGATGHSAHDLRLDLAALPCTPVARAAAWIGARRLSATPGSEIVSGHVDYRFEDPQVQIDLTGEFGGQECLRVIEIYKRSRT